jgi:hypothetical protein
MPYANSEDRTRQRRAYWIKNRERLTAYNREYRAKNPDKIREIRLKYLYGLSLKDKQARINSQEGLCANPACNQPLVIGTACTDHNHTTDELRSELCAPCNLAVGHLKDSPARALGLAVYLSRFEDEWQR